MSNENLNPNQEDSNINTSNANDTDNTNNTNNTNNTDQDFLNFILNRDNTSVGGENLNTSQLDNQVDNIQQNNPDLNNFLIPTEDKDKTIGEILSNQPTTTNINVSDNFQPNETETNVDENKPVQQIETPEISTQPTSQLGLTSILGTPVSAAETVPYKDSNESQQPVVKKEKPADNSDNTIYDVATGVAIGGNIPFAVDANDPRSTFNQIFGRNFIDDDVSKKILAGKASEITDKDIQNESVMTSLNASLFNFGVKAPEFVFKLNAAIDQYVKYFATGYNPPVEESEIKKVDNFIKNLPYVGDNYELSKKLTEGTLAGRIALDTEELVGALALSEVLLPVGAIMGLGDVAAGAIESTSALSSEGIVNGVSVAKNSGITSSLNSMLRSSRFASILGLTEAGVKAELTNSLIVDSGNTPNLIGNYFGVTPLKADLNQAPTAIEELNRLTINKLKGGPDFLLYGIGGEALTKVYNQAIKPAARILFYDGESPVLKEAAKQTQDIIKNDGLLEEFHDNHLEQDNLNYEYVPTTLYSGLPVDATIDAISNIANKMKKFSPKISYWIKNNFLPVISAQKGLPDDIWKAFYDSMNMIKGANIPASHSAEMINSALDQVFAKNPELLNSVHGEEMHSLLDDLIHSGENEMGKVAVDVGELKLTPTEKFKLNNQVKALRNEQQAAWNRGDYVTYGSRKDAADLKEAAVYKNKPTAYVTGEDLLDYHKVKFPEDVPTRYSNYPGEHWTDRAKAFNRARTGQTGEQETNKLTFNKTQLQFKKFDSDKLLNFQNKMKEFGASDEQITNLINGAIGVRLRMLDYFNRFITDENYQEMYKSFENIMRQRTSNYLASEYKIYNNKNSMIGNSWKPTMEARNDVRNIIIENAKKYGRDLSADDATLNTMLNDIANASVDKKTGSLQFITENLDRLADNVPDYLETNFKNLRDSEGKFIGNSLIQTEEQLKAFQKYLGKTTNVAKNSYNLITDSAKYISRSKFYNTLMDLNEARIAKGETPYFVSDRIQAKKLFPEAEAKGKIDETAYSPTQKYLNPFAGLPNNGKWYTGSSAITDAMNFTDKLLIDDFLGNSIIMNGVGKLNRFISMKDTTLSLDRQILNPINYIVISSLTGNLYKDPFKVWSLVKQLSNSELGTVGGALKPTAGSALELSADQKLLQKYIEKGIGMTNLSVSNIEAMLKEEPEIFKKLISGRLPTITEKIANIPQRAVKIAGNLYVGSDNLVKFFNVNAEIDSLYNAYAKKIAQGAIDPKTGQKYVMPSFDELFDRAANKVQDMFPNYGKLSDFMKTIAKVPLFGQFSIWPEEMLRTGKNTIKIAYDEINNDVEKEIGFKRMFSIMGTSTMVLGAGSYVWNKFTGIDSKTQNSVQTLASKYSQDSDLLVIKPDSFGRWGYIDMNHFLPYAVWSSLATAMIANYKKEALLHPEQNPFKTLAKGEWDGIINSLKSLSEEKFVPKIFEALYTGKTDTKKRIYDDLDSAPMKLWKGTEYIIKEGIIPPTLDTLSRLEHAYMGTPDETGHRYNKLDETLGLFGLRIHRIDPLRAFDGAIGEYTDTMTKINKEISTLNSEPNHNDDQIKEKLLLLSQQKYDAMSQLGAKYKAALNLFPDAEAGKDQIKSPLHQMHNIRLLNKLEDGEFEPIKSFNKQEQKYLGREEETNTRYFEGKPMIAVPDREKLKDDIQNINEDIRGIPLYKDFNKLIDKDKYLNPQNQKIPTTANFSFNPNLTNNATLGGNSPPVNSQVLKSNVNPNQQANEERTLFNA